MKKVLFAILAVFTILGTVICLGFTIFYQPKAETVYDVSTINTSSLTEHTVLYIDDLEILARYAFKTAESTYDVFGQPEDTNYYVYEASQPMDENALWAEYYVVKFTDNKKEYIASLTVSAVRNVSFKNTPVRITALVDAFPASADTADNLLSQLRQAALENYAQRTGAAKATISLGYQDQSTQQRQTAVKKETAELKWVMGIIGLILAAFSAWFITDYIKKIRSK